MGGVSGEMLIGERLREIREAKKLSQGDVEHRAGAGEVPKLTG
jgi:transcriptional regulator with XRE-family HTH domain